VLQPEPGQVAFFPIVEAIQEFKVEVNSPPAEFGRFNGGVVNLTTRSGTNAFHGSGFEFLRNEKLNARNLFAPSTAANPNKPVFRRNQFGFVAGGPIIKDQTFSFGDYRGRVSCLAGAHLLRCRRWRKGHETLFNSGLYFTCNQTVRLAPP
jgi:hypothetical protein